MLKNNMRKTLPYIIIVAAVLLVGIFLIKPGKKQMPQSKSANLPTQGQESIGTNMEETTSESYASGITLDISQPQPNTTVTSPTLIVKGRTSPSAEVFVNDVESKADAAGNFTATITLDEGENPIIVVVNDADGNSAENQILVNYEPGQ